jgi:ArsR family transcriptional regulator, arsenate/arsenite/antimonite-responsive transcriptional repressor / arsenate reductase (thioredoxin)
MESRILQRLTTLGHPQRMAVFRLLMRRFPDSLPAGEIAHTLRLKPSTLSVYLAALSNCGLIGQQRRGTSLLYRIEMEAARALVSDLFHDCCRGRPDLCLPPIGAPCNVLFVCSGNTARSVFAEALLRDKGAGRFQAWSAGTAPRAAVHPVAEEVLRDYGHDLSGLNPKSLSAVLTPEAPPMDVVLTVCDLSANEDVAAWPGQPVMAHWGLPDPAAVTGSPTDVRHAFETTYLTLRDRIRKFSALPLTTLDRAAVQRELDLLGQKEPA